MKKFLMSIVAALAIAFAVPQNADAKIYRGFSQIDEGLYMTYTYNDRTGHLMMQIIDDEGNIYMTYNDGYVNYGYCEFY